MPRKPFLQIYKPGMHYAIGPNAIGDRPELASLVGRCIAIWSDIELQVGLSLGAILKANNEAAVALFLAIKTSRTQRDALTAVARLLLCGDDLDVFEALLSVYASLEKQRNALAHGLFGILNDIPDTLLWSDIQSHANFLINAYLAEYQGRPLADPHAKLRKDMFIYTRGDLEELLRDLTELQKAAFHFHCHHQPREKKPQNHLKEMMELPAIRAAFETVKNNRQPNAGACDLP
jgi:hypothetical protein